MGTHWQALRHYCGGLVLRDEVLDGYTGDQAGLNCTNCGKRFSVLDVPQAADVAEWDMTPVVFHKDDCPPRREAS